MLDCLIQKRIRHPSGNDWLSGKKWVWIIASQGTAASVYASRLAERQVDFASFDFGKLKKIIWVAFFLLFLQIINLLYLITCCFPSLVSTVIMHLSLQRHRIMMEETKVYLIFRCLVMHGKRCCIRVPRGFSCLVICCQSQKSWWNVWHFFFFFFAIQASTHVLFFFF